jgi:hypothetical protein
MRIGSNFMIRERLGSYQGTTSSRAEGGEEKNRGFSPCKDQVAQGGNSFVVTGSQAAVVNS